MEWVTQDEAWFSVTDSRSFFSAFLHGSVPYYFLLLSICLNFYPANRNTLELCKFKCVVFASFHSSNLLNITRKTLEHLLELIKPHFSLSRKRGWLMLCSDFVQRTTFKMQNVLNTLSKSQTSLYLFCSFFLDFASQFVVITANAPNVIRGSWVERTALVILLLGLAFVISQQRKSAQIHTQPNEYSRR